MSFILRNQTTTISPMYLLQFDGGANPNPGPCAGAYVIYKLDESGEKTDILYEGGRYLTDGTNNIGEYMGLLEGLRICKENNLDKIRIEGDSKLVVYQIANQWKVNHKHLREYYTQISKILQCFTSVSIQHIYREYNQKADELSDETLIKRNTWMRF